MRYFLNKTVPGGWWLRWLWLAAPLQISISHQQDDFMVSGGDSQVHFVGIVAVFILRANLGVDEASLAG